MNSGQSKLALNNRHLVLLEEFDRPEEGRASSKRRRDLVLLGIFVAVVFGAALYNFVIATPRYASQFSYVVRSLDSSRERFSFLNFASTGGNADNSEAIVAYIESRDILAEINFDGLAKRGFASGDVDMFSAFPSLLSGDSEEDFYQHFQKYVSAEFDAQTNITTVEVQAFSSEDAQTLAERIMRASEKMVNSLNARARAGMVESAQNEVNTATSSFTEVLDRMSTIRDRSEVLDPELSANSAIAVSSASASELAQINVELAQTLRVAPNSPLIPQLRSRRAAIIAELERQTRETAGAPGSLASRIRQYEGLNAEREVAEKQLAASSLALASARNSANRNRLYVERISTPSLPDMARYPRGARNLIFVILITAAVIWILRSLSELVFEDDG